MEYFEFLNIYKDLLCDRLWKFGGKRIITEQTAQLQSTNILGNMIIVFRLSSFKVRWSTGGMETFPG